MFHEFLESQKSNFKTSHVFNRNKIAFGHYMDDALKTLFMNMIYLGSISSIPYKYFVLDSGINVIRPFHELTNDELIQLTKLHEYQ